MSVLFNHALRYEWLEQGTNAITIVRQSAQHQWTPEISGAARDPKSATTTQFVLSPYGR
jgi:hypothetical protein